jgi:hypothetical protein
MTRPADSVRLARGCWVTPDDVDDLVARCAAAVESAGEFTVVASVTAARLHGFWLPELPDAIHLATATPDRLARAMSRTRRPEFVGHRYRLGERDIVNVQGVDVTAPARTWCDLAAVLRTADLVAAGDSALRGGVTGDELTAAATRSRRAHYLARARAALPMLDARSRSHGESHLRVALWTPDMPRFAINEPIFRREGGWLAEPDLSLAPARIALEYQGADHAELQRMRKDLTRFADMRRDGWLVLPYGPAEVYRRPWQVRGEVRAEIGRRAPHLLVGRRARSR